MVSENINPVLFLAPLVPIIFSFVLIFYWRSRRSFRWRILLFTLVAYAVAIIAKTIIQLLTLPGVESRFGYVSAETGLYFGIQTSFLEVGIAYVVALYAFRSKVMVESDAEAYGLSLSFWENGVLLGILSLVSILGDYLMISGGGSLGQTVRTELLSVKPGYFATTNILLPSIGYSILERVSSLLAHFSWGFLTVVAVARKKPIYFLIALPMGLIDALVPFAGTMGIPLFETTVFALSVIFLVIAIIVRRKEHIPIRAPVREEALQGL